MRADFFKDYNGTVWFFYAHDISWRESVKHNATSSHEAKKQAKKAQQNKEALRKQMISELESYEDQQKSQKS